MINYKKMANWFSERWKDRGYEKGETSKFWIDLLQNVYGIENATNYIFFEKSVQLKNKSFIDASIPSTNVIIEQKSIDKDLTKKEKQSDGEYMTPYEQAKRYSDELPRSEKPKYIIVSNFKEFHIHDMEHPHSDPQIILLKNLDKEYHRLLFLVDEKHKNIQKEKEVSLKAGELVGKIYDELLKQYNDKNSPETLNNLNILCVRLVFLLYAEDSGILGKRDMFYDYLNKYRDNVNTFRNSLIELFKILNQKPEERDPYLDKELLDFPYINGGLFADDKVVIPRITKEIIEIILDKASIGFDWSDISPTIFGGVFESTLNPETRRFGGMHYTSIENIHKLINPLFLENLEKEFSEINNIKLLTTRKKRLLEFQDKIANLTFLDPACGSGNFLTETYLSLRRLENRLIRELNNQGQISIGETQDDIIKVSLKQFYGIEINDFAVVVAKTALWIAEAQMFMETMSIVNRDNDFLPLKSFTNIVEANSLRINWEDIIKAEDLNYIMGNPPFVGKKFQNREQKKDMELILGDIKGYNMLDYVSCWYHKSIKIFEKNKDIKIAFVSTNSICQGEQTSIMWEEILKKDININFAYQSFNWESEANDKAHVYCVIVGLSKKSNEKKRLYYKELEYKLVNNINAYLYSGENIFLKRRTSHIQNELEMTDGNVPIDDNQLKLELEELKELEKKEPQSLKYIKKLTGSNEFINKKERFVIWIEEYNPGEIRNMPIISDRIKKVREFRSNSSTKSTSKLADIPYRFRDTRNPKTALIIPRVSSERRKYVPIGFITSDTIALNSVLLLSNASLYHFGVLTSNAHMIWLDKIGGKLETRYRYSATVVYNNFPFPKCSESQKEKIEQTAQKILEVRDKYANSTYADLYDTSFMPEDLRKAHYENDKAVWEAYSKAYEFGNEDSCFEFLCNQYEKLTKKERLSKKK
ncbi:DNA methyltransferase [Oceanivirga miroungae]|uniref:site-specific DNA-methyltransferase (adenine-specific) n=1 Tax=Oceanivirga miroungae TaxID=1130046 RepID=A0A6I8M784_9FUSO|nr:DNA methyltransferase [Oceanivirga miroungae]VWL85276.1 hypothetical protein OMES3154_00559 [Oceanivirga miroungae]